MFAILLGAKGTKKDTPPPPAPVNKTVVNPADQCQVKTKDGDQCKRKATAGSKFCWQQGGKGSTKTIPKK